MQPLMAVSVGYSMQPEGAKARNALAPFVSLKACAEVSGLRCAGHKWEKEEMNHGEALASAL